MSVCSDLESARNTLNAAIAQIKAEQMTLNEAADAMGTAVGAIESAEEALGCGDP